MTPLSPREIIAANGKVVLPHRSPGDIAAVLDSFGYLYDWRQDYRVRSALSSLASPKLMCLDAAILAYGLLDLFPGVPRKILVMHRRAPDGEECGHAAAVYRDPGSGQFGSFARSNYPELEHRLPEFRDEKTLALSYARAYTRIGFTPLYFGFADLDELSGPIDWRCSPDDWNTLADRLAQSYQYGLNLREKAEPTRDSGREGSEVNT